MAGARGFTVKRHPKLYRALALDLLDVARSYAYWHVHSRDAGIYEIIRSAEKILGVPERNQPENGYVYKIPPLIKIK